MYSEALKRRLAGNSFIFNVLFSQSFITRSYSLKPIVVMSLHQSMRVLGDISLHNLCQINLL